jgi:hypothetical protein
MRGVTELETINLDSCIYDYPMAGVREKVLK